MARVVYLHVGAPKTGTTYLQDRLSLNRVELETREVHYPIGLRADMFGGALDLIDQPWGGLRERVHGEWEALAQRVHKVPTTAVVSHEILAGARPAQVQRAVKDLGDAEIHLVYSARDLARQIPAEWQEGVKHQRGRTFEAFLEKVQHESRRHSDLWFWRVQGLPDVLERWSDGLPPERVHLVTVPQAGAPRDELWLRYCRAFGIDPAWAPQDSERENVSIGTAESQLVRKLNRRLKRAGLDPDSYRTLVRQLVVHETLAQRPRMTRVTLPPALHPWAAEIAEEWVEWVQGSGIDVIGDLEDLRPVPPPEGAKWRNPDRPRNVKVADAALDALVAVIMEASSPTRPRRRALRPDGEGRTAAAGPVTAPVEIAAASWVEHLRQGGTTPWLAWVPPPSAVGSGDIPGAAQLELLRRLNVVGGSRYVDRVLARTGAGRGMAELPLIWPGREHSYGPAPVDPGQVPPDELVRVGVGLLVDLLVEVLGHVEEPEPRRPRWRAPKYSLTGSPLSVEAAAHRLTEAGYPPGRGRPKRSLVVVRPVEQMLAEAWAARVLRGATTRWTPFVQRWQAKDRLPPEVRVAALARRAAGRVDVVLGPANVADVLGFTGVGTPAQLLGPHGTELLRRTNRILDLRLPAAEVAPARARLAAVFAVEPDAPITVPEGSADWLRTTGERVAGELARGGYAVHGDLTELARTTAAERHPRGAAVLDVLIGALLNLEE